MEISEAVLSSFWYWIRERETIRRKKEERFPSPWTKDPILRDNHFCNVRREDDRGTKEIREVVLSHDWLLLDDLPWVYTLARMLNKASSLDLALDYYQNHHGQWMAPLKNRMEMGATVFHTAYVVSTNGRRMNKLEFIAEVVKGVQRLGLDPDKDSTCLQVYHKLMSVSGIGSFLAGQIIADLKNDHFLVDALDWFSWSSLGPGSKKGLDYIFGPGTTHKNYQLRMTTLVNLMPVDIMEMGIHMQDLQNCLCEFSKYMALLTGTRRRSRPYHPL